MKTGPKPIPIERRFWRFINPLHENECWIWRGNKLPSGYGLISKMRGKHEYAHRLSYRMHKGEIPNGLIVMHSCDNPSCVNPNHLSVGTYSDNSFDCVKKGRHAKLDFVGVNHPRCQFSELTVQRIKIVKGAIGYWRLAGLIGKNVGTVQNIMNGKNWKHLGLKQALMF